MPSTRDSAIEIALQNCGAEPIHAPGTIQPNGALVGIDKSTFEICYASENADEVLNVGSDMLLGRSAGDLLATFPGPEAFPDFLLEAAKGPSRELGIRRIGMRDLSISTCSSGAYAILEMEAEIGSHEKTGPFEEALLSLGQRLSETPHPFQMFDEIVTVLRELSGYDRVLMLKFSENGDGEVLSEDCAPDVSAFLGLNFPAWDIPSQARELMLKVPCRYIFDTSAEGVPVRAAHMSLPALDMTFAHLRSSSIVHLEYMRNMGVAAGFTLSVVVNGRLWGMIAMHHRTQRVPTRLFRSDCLNLIEVLQRALEKNLVQAASFQLARALEQPREGRRKSDPLLPTSPDPTVLETLSRSICADGAIFDDGQALVSTGRVPHSPVLLSLLAPSRWPDGVSMTACLKEDFPDISAAFGEMFAGLLIAKIDPTRLYAFFRLEEQQTVSWAGTPVKDIFQKDGRFFLLPRTSFEVHEQVFEGQSKPWSREQICLAERLCNQPPCDDE